MSPRQRRGVLLLILAGVGLIVTFALVSGYVSDVRGQVEPKVRVVQLADDIRDNQPFSAARLRTVSLPERWAPRTAIRDTGQLNGLVAVGDLPKGSVVQQGMAVQPPNLAPGQREIAILVDAETGVAGKVQPGDIVDIVGTFPGNDDRRDPPRSRIVVSGARIVAVGGVSSKGRPNADQNDSQSTIPVTFALSVKAALKVTYAESFADEVRLALLREGDRSNVPAANQEYSQTP